MGYILPITNYQVVQYSNRTALSKKEPLKLFPVKNLRVEPLKNEAHSMQYIKQSFKQSYYGEKEELVNEIVSELTGKGRNFNGYA